MVRVNPNIEISTSRGDGMRKSEPCLRRPPKDEPSTSKLAQQRVWMHCHNPKIRYSHAITTSTAIMWCNERNSPLDSMMQAKRPVDLQKLVAMRAMARRNHCGKRAAEALSPCSSFMQDAAGRQSFRRRCFISHLFATLLENLRF